MGTRMMIVAGLGIAVLGSGCAAGARVVRSEANGGELAMWGPVMSAAKHGRAALVEQCPRGYVVSTSGDGLGLGHATLPESAAPNGASGERIVRFRCTPDGALLAHR